MDEMLVHPVLADVDLDFASVFQLGWDFRQYFKTGQGDIPGMFLNASAPPVFAHPQTIRDVQLLLSTLRISASPPESRPREDHAVVKSVAFLELSLFDPYDAEGNYFYTVLYGPTEATVERYLEQMSRNLEVQEPSSQRGPLVPNKNLYDSAFYYMSYAEERRCDPIGANPAIYFGVYRDASNPREPKAPELKRQLGDFFEAVVSECLAKPDGFCSVNSAILCPVLRPSARDRKYGSKAIRGGGLFIYGKAADGFQVKDFALTVGNLLARGLLNMSMPKTEERVIQTDVAKAWGHEMNSVARALEIKWAPPILECQLLEVERVPAAALPPNRIAHMRVSADWAAELAIVPYQSFLRTVSALMSLWCMQAKPEDSPIGKPGSLKEVIQEAWRFASSVIALFALRNYGMGTYEQLSETVQIAKDIQALLNAALRDSVQGAAAEWKVLWDEEHLKWNMTYIRVLMALFMNCLKHGDPSRGVRVTATLERAENGTQTLLTRIENDRWPMRDNAPDRDAVTERFCRGEGLRPGLLDSLKTPLETVVYRISAGRSQAKNISGFSTRNVILVLTQSLKWTLEGDLLLERSSGQAEISQNQPFSVLVRSPLSGDSSHVE